MQMKKKNIIFITLITLLVIAVVLIIKNNESRLLSYISKSCPSEEKLDQDYGIAICDWGNPEDEEILERLIMKWLVGYTQMDVSEEMRLYDYKIKSIEIKNDLTTPDGTYLFSIGAHVNYSVLPFLEVPQTHWIAPDGKIGENGWIIEKRIYVGVIYHNNGIYELKLLGTCPTC